MGEVLRDSRGRWLPGSSPASRRPKTSLADLIRKKFSEEMEIYLGDKLTREERSVIMAEVLAQLISTGEVHFPDRVGENGERIAGKVFKYSGSEWAKQLLRLLRYVEPPITNIEVSGGVDGIVFDKEIEGDESDGD
jgi:hypothetical protein